MSNGLRMKSLGGYDSAIPQDYFPRLVLCADCEIGSKSQRLGGFAGLRV